MSLIKLNDRAVKDVTQFGSISSLGSLTHISTATASASASIEFTSGIDSTYKEYVFYYVNMHPSVDNAFFQFNMSTDNGSNYNVAKTTTFFRAYHTESDAATDFLYETGYDLAQGTGLQFITPEMGNLSDECVSGNLILFNPSSTTFVKHFISNTNHNSYHDISENCFGAGYGNTTSAVNAIKFEMTSGNIDSGQILLFGVN